MANCRKIQVINGEFQLPEPIIQHIQSFLTGKEAAQTTVLSKSWYSAWLTRPNLDFDQRYFRRNRWHGLLADDGFSEFSNKTLQRYNESNLKIESFRLCVNGWTWDNKSLANELIVKAMKLGATHLEFVDYCYCMLLPHEVLGSENLVSLSLQGCTIGLRMDGKFRCSRLKSLSLHGVVIEGDIIWDIISSCPLIEKLLLSDCTCLFQVETFDVFTRKMTKVLPLSPFTEIGKQNVGSVGGGPITLYEFHKLKCLVLERVRIDNSFFCDFSTKFPCLKNLRAHNCAGYEEIQISSRSLECISFAQDKMLTAKFDVPRIHKFRFSGLVLPVLAFENASREWESDIFVMCSQPGTSLFLSLREFLVKLSMSKVSLSILFDHFLEKSYDYGRDIKGLPKPMLENLKISVFGGSGVCCAHLDALVWSCRPKFITQYWFVPKSSSEIAKKELLDLLCKTLVQEVSENCYIPNRNMHGLHDLMEVNVEIFEESVAEWRPLPWKTLFDASASPENKREVRFQLKWV